MSCDRWASLLEGHPAGGSQVIGSVLSCLMLVASCAAFAGPMTDWKTADALAKAFIELAVSGSPRANGGSVKKWGNAVNYSVVHHVGEQGVHERLVHIHMHHLHQLTGVDIRAAANMSQANFLVVLTSEDRLADDIRTFLDPAGKGLAERAFRNSVCIASIRSDATGNIRRAVTLIPVDRARGSGDLIGCVAEELTHMMGLIKDTQAPLPSIFNHAPPRCFLSGLDAVLLRMLYDPRIKAGMTTEALRAVLNAIATEFRNKGVMDAEESRAASSGLANECL